MSDLRDHLFDTLERLKSNNDSEASENEKIDIETVSAIVDVSSQIIESYKVEVQAMSLLSKSANPTIVNQHFQQSGLMSKEIQALPAS